MGFWGWGFNDGWLQTKASWADKMKAQRKWVTACWSTIHGFRDSGGHTGHNEWFPQRTSKTSLLRLTFKIREFSWPCYPYYCGTAGMGSHTTKPSLEPMTYIQNWAVAKHTLSRKPDWIINCFYNFICLSSAQCCSLVPLHISNGTFKTLVVVSPCRDKMALQPPRSAAQISSSAEWIINLLCCIIDCIKQLLTRWGYLTQVLPITSHKRLINGRRLWSTCAFEITTVAELQ